MVSAGAGTHPAIYQALMDPLGVALPVVPAAEKVRRLVLCSAAAAPIFFGFHPDVTTGSGYWLSEFKDTVIYTDRPIYAVSDGPGAAICVIEDC